MYKVIWRYKVKAEFIKDFLKIYDANGEWVQLFSKSSDFIKTALFNDVNADQYFLTIDYWKSKEAYQNFYKQHHKEIKQIDVMGDQMTLLEEKLDEFMSK
ncbi:MAG: antibiotic biosynthesis monooxygenase [Reichenbachiella sp.]|uniref:antibiotic biosynthesis monooxygenase family protein n=1 Tax=Reichenbachiella sp. TaxID=2184521 RepID=UPI00329698CC